MKKLGKLFSSLLAGLSAFALSVSPAYANAIARNVNIIDSTVYVEATEDFFLENPIFNIAEDVGWWIDTEANTGGDYASDGGLIETGPAGVLTDVSTGVNSTDIFGGVDLGGQTLAENDTITNSWVEADASKTSYLDVITDNVAIWVGSVIGGYANSGDNTAVGGSSGDGGEIYTGLAGFGAISETTANSNSLWASVDMSGDTTARNLDVTDSYAEANASSEVGVGVYTTNWAWMVGNIVNGYADSGSNEASGGDGLDGGNGGLIDTGLALFGSDTSTAVNSNETVLAVDLGGATEAENVGIDSSYVEADADSSAWVEVVNENDAWMVGNVVGGWWWPGEAYANSGGNTANGGDAWYYGGGDGGDIYTGVAGAAVLADTSANSNAITVVGNIGGSTTARNSGVDSPLWWNGAYAYADSEAGVSVVNDNDSLGGNIISVGANSGENEANGGDGWFWTGGNGGSISTGNAGVIIGSSVAMNDNYTWVEGDFGGNSTAENLLVDSSYAYAEANSETYVEVSNFNDVYAVNSVEAYANTGENEANGGNDGGFGGEIYTGDALLLAEVDTVVNTSETYVVGDFTGNATAANSGIFNSEVEAYADANSEVLVVNDNADFGGTEVTISVLAYANTGDNQANGDGDGGEIYTGEAFLVTDVGTTVNSSTTMVAGAGGGNTTASNTAVSGSSATADASSTGSTTVVNTNSADVETSVATSANTGDNDASGSSSGGIISTGSAVNGTLVSTTVNTNDTTVVVKSGDASASNTGVSGVSSATATADSSTSTTVTNTNDATVVNNVSTSSNTGGNTAVDGGTVSTGGAGTVTSGSTTTNTNTVNLVVGP